MSAYRVETAFPGGADWINDAGSVFESSFWRTAFPIVTPQT